MAHRSFKDIGGLFGLDLGDKPGRSQSGSQRIESLFTDEQGRGFAGRADVLAGQRTQNPFLSQLQGQFRQKSPFQGALNERVLNPRENPFGQTLQDALLNPQFGGQRSEAEQNLISQLQSGRQGQFNALGIGQSPAAQTSIAAAAAPALLGFRQDRLNNLFRGSQNFASEDQRGISNLFGGQAQFGLDQSRTLQNLLGASGQFGQQDITQRGMNIETLMQLAQFGEPRYMQQSTETGPVQGILGQLTGAFKDVFG